MQSLVSDSHSHRAFSCHCYFLYKVSVAVAPQLSDCSCLLSSPLLLVDWPWSGSQTCWTRFAHEPDLIFRFGFMFLARPNLNWGPGSTPWVDLNLRSKPEPWGSATACAAYHTRVDVLCDDLMHMHDKLMQLMLPIHAGLSPCVKLSI